MWPFDFLQSRDGKSLWVKPSLEGATFETEYARFVRRILEGRPATSPQVHRLTVIEMLGAICASSRQGKAVAVKG